MVVAGEADSAHRLRTELATGVRARLAEIEQAMLMRVYAISDPSGLDPSYVHGLRNSVSVALGYALEAIEASEGQAPAPPPALLAQARLAARNGVGLDTVLRRCVAGDALLGNYLAAEAARLDLRNGDAVIGVLQSRAAFMDRLLAAVSDEYAAEAQAGLTTTAQRCRAERVEQLLAGEAVDTSEFGYDLGGHHIGIVASGHEAERTVRRLAGTLDRRLLLVRPTEAEVWAWLGGRRTLSPEDAFSAVADAVGHAESTHLALGEPAECLTGWRLTHRQAQAALLIAHRSGTPLVRYRDIALVASIAGDELLATSLRRLYLEPLIKRGRGGGEAALETLHAYFRSRCNITSAAASLSIDRHTVAARLRAVEQRLGRSLDMCRPDLALICRFHLNRCSSPA